MMETSRRGFEMVGKRKINTPPLKRVLRGRLCDKVVSEQATTLGLDGPEISHRTGI
jgi:hypothetical protein